MYHVSHHHTPNDIHEITMTRMNNEAVRQLYDISARIFETSEAENVYLLIDAREARMLPLRLLAMELRHLAQRDGSVKSCIAIVIASPDVNDATASMIQTILDRDRVEIFTDVVKARMWLDMERNRHMG